MKDLLEKLAAGTTTVDDVLKAIDESDKDKVPRSRLNDKIQDIKDLETELQTRNDQLNDLSVKAKGNDDLIQEIQTLKDTNAQQQKDYDDKFQQQAFDTKLTDALRNAKVRNPRAVKALLEADKIKLDGDTLLGLDDQLGALKESDAYLFASEEIPPGLQGRTPHTPPNQPPTGLTKEQFNKMNYNERVKLHTENPDVYAKLQS